MNKILKGVIGLSAVGSIAGGGIVANHYLSKENIESKLKANGYTILTDSNDAVWTEILKNYTTIVKTKSNLKFGSFVGNDDANNTEAKRELQRQCREALDKRVEDDNQKEENYKRAEKWCIKPLSVSERLNLLGFDALDTNESESVQPTQWDAKLEKYKQTTQKPTFLAGLTENIDKDNRDKIKKACEAPLKKKTYENDYEASLIDAKEWCAIEKPKKTT